MKLLDLLQNKEISHQKARAEKIFKALRKGEITMMVPGSYLNDDNDKEFKFAYDLGDEYHIRDIIIQKWPSDPKKEGIAVIVGDFYIGCKESSALAQNNSIKLAVTNQIKNKFEKFNIVLKRDPTEFPKRNTTQMAINEDISMYKYRAERAKTILKAFSKGEFTFDAPIYFGDTEKWKVNYKIIKDLDKFDYFVNQYEQTYIDGFMEREGRPVFELSAIKVADDSVVNLNHGLYRHYCLNATYDHLSKLLGKFKIYANKHS